jgi:hypothetical protein
MRLALALVAGLCLTTQAQRTATAAATVINGFVVAITVTDGGAGYTEAPTVTLSGGGGSGATALALLTAGAVSQIIVLTAGSGYISSPEVIISAPYIPPVEPPVLALQMVPLITILGSPGDTNQIETATTLGAGAVWVPLTNVVLTSSVYEWYDRISTPGVQRFYRAEQVGAGAHKR